MYTNSMEVSITKFRSNLFSFLQQALQGEIISVIYHGNRFQLVPEKPASGRLAQVAPLTIVATGVDILQKSNLQQEMEHEWSKDWSHL